MINQYELIPEAAFLYFPQDEKTVQHYNGHKQRIIFSGDIEFDDDEKQKVAQLRNKIRDNPKIAQCQDYSDDFLLRSYQAAQFKLDDTIRCLKEYYQWEQKTLPLIISPKTQSLLKHGILYMSGRDCYFRPIIVVNAKRILDLKISKEELTICLSFFFQFVIENMMIEGQVEQWTILIDLGNASLFSLGKSMLDIIVHLSSIFKVRAVKNFLIACPSSIKMLWSALKGALNQDQIRKISMSQKKFLKPNDFQLINPSQIQQKYGGTYPDMQQYWPLHLNPHSVYVDQIKTSEQMISQAEYDMMFNQGRLKDRKVKRKYVTKFEKISKLGNKISDLLTEREQLSGNQDDFSSLTASDNDNDQVQYPTEQKPIQAYVTISAPLSFNDLF